MIPPGVCVFVVTRDVQYLDWNRFDCHFLHFASSAFHLNFSAVGIACFSIVKSATIEVYCFDDPPPLARDQS